MLWVALTAFFAGLVAFHVWRMNRLVNDALRRQAVNWQAVVETQSRIAFSRGYLRGRAEVICGNAAYKTGYDVGKVDGRRQAIRELQTPSAN